MGLPLYFVPNAQGGLAGVKAAGLEYALPSPEYRPLVSGPGDASGVLFCHSAARLTYEPAAQTWRRLPDGNAWFGWWNDAPPTPDELRRAELLDGHPVKLRDGREWLVPMARTWSQMGLSPRLPAMLDFNEAGELKRGAVEPAYRDLETAAEEYSAFCFDGTEVLKTKLVEWAASALAVNYRLGRYESLSLGLFDDQLIACQDVLRAVIDWPGYLALTTEKKAAGQHTDEPSTALGDAA